MLEPLRNVTGCNKRYATYRFLHLDRSISISVVLGFDIPTKICFMNGIQYPFADLDGSLGREFDRKI